MIGNLSNSTESVNITAATGEGSSFALAVLLANSVTMDSQNVQAIGICCTYEAAVQMVETLESFGVHASIPRHSGKKFIEMKFIS